MQLKVKSPRYFSGLLQKLMFETKVLETLQQHYFNFHLECQS